MKDELCEALELDLGRGKFYGFITEVFGVRAEIEHTLHGLDQWMKREAVDTPIILAPGKCYITPEPLGVVCVMSAWNFPYVTLLGPVQNAIAAGNCVLIKPSEMSPRCSIVVTKLCEKYLDQRFYKVI